MLLMKIIENSGKCYESIMEIIMKIRDKRPNVHLKYRLIQEQEVLFRSSHQVSCVISIFRLISHNGYSCSFFYWPLPSRPFWGICFLKAFNFHSLPILYLCYLAGP